jgi:hypothetical protein
MIYEMLLFLFIAMALIYFALVGILLHREPAGGARENRAKDQKASLLPSDFEYLQARLSGRERMLRILPMAVRYHYERLRPKPAEQESNLQKRGGLSVKRLARRHRIAHSIWKVHLQAEVRYHFYKYFPLQAEHRTLDSSAYGELEEQVRFHFHRLCPTMETEGEPIG